MDDPLVMGILNITPDSFYDGGKYYDSGSALEQTRLLISEGADIIDVGAFSSRPGAGLLNEQEEANRLYPVLDIIRTNFPDVVVSVDTFRAKLAKEVVEKYEVDIINDISAGSFDNDMFDAIAELGVPYIMMHMKGTPETMQIDPFYENMMFELIDYFSEKIDALRYKGVSDIIIDPGFGFAKNIEHNYELLSRLDELKVFELPVLVGLSRKSMISRVLELDAADSLNGTTAANMLALVKGVNILRVHDVKQAKECIQIYKSTFPNRI